MPKEKPESPLFDVIFDGRPFSGVPLEKAVQGLAGLLRKTPDDIAHLFNQDPTVLKRNVSEKTALQYCQALHDVGLACRIARTGSPLESGRGKTSSAPQTDNAPAGENHGAQSRADKQEARRFSFPDSGRLLGLLTLSVLLPRNLVLEAAPADCPTATMGQKIWSAVSTFLHGVFLGYVLAFAVGLAAGMILRFSGADITQSTIEAIRGGSVLLGLITAVFLVPLLWRGHSFGQRALGIVAVPTTGEDLERLGGAAILIRKLTFQTRSASAAPMPHRPWNGALGPFAAIVILHLVLIPFSMAVVGGEGSSDIAYLRREITSNRTTDAERSLRDVRVAVYSYVAKNFISGSTLLTPALFEKAIQEYLPWHIRRGLWKKLKNGDLRLAGPVSDFRIGIHEDGFWMILDAGGGIRQAESF